MGFVVRQSSASFQLQLQLQLTRNQMRRPGNHATTAVCGSFLAHFSSAIVVPYIGWDDMNHIATIDSLDSALAFLGTVMRMGVFGMVQCRVTVVLLF